MVVLADIGCSQHFLNANSLHISGSNLSQLDKKVFTALEDRYVE